VKASIDAATARDNENARLRAELYHDWFREYKWRIAAEKLIERLETENTALQKRLSQTAKREKRALRKLDELKGRLRELSKEA
jgi:hypothetical protein